MKSVQRSQTSRRAFLKMSSVVGGFFVLPSGLWSNPPNSKICIAHIGVGGMGGHQLRAIGKNPKVEVVALCDVDFVSSEMQAKQQEYPSARTFHDYREMFAVMGDKIDAVGIATPDHTHYPATLAAMKLGKHVYTQKPLTHNIAEARHLMELDRESKLVTQMGIQHHSGLTYRIATKYLRDGIIGKVSKVYVWSHKVYGYDGPRYTEENPVPENLDWNLWLGVAPVRPYVKGKYHPLAWRNYLDFGAGTLGDMGVHIFDTPFNSLRLDAPKWVKSTCREPTGFGFPTKNKVEYGFGETEYTTKELLWTWYDGEAAAPVDEPDCKLPDMKLPRQGAIFVGEKGRILLPHTGGPRFYPVEIQRSLPPHGVPKGGDHISQFIQAIPGTTKTSAGFDYAARLTEVVLLGTISGRFPGKTLQWDSANMKFPNMPEADQYVRREHRDMDKDKAVYETTKASQPKNKIQLEGKENAQKKG